MGGATTKKSCSVCGNRSDRYSRECKSCGMAYCSTCKQAHMKRIGRRRWKHKVCPTRRHREQDTPVKQESRQTLRQRRKQDTRGGGGGVKQETLRHQHQKPRRQILKQQILKRQLKPVKRQQRSIDVDRIKAMSDREEKEARILEREGQYEDAMNRYMRSAEIIIPVSKSNLEFISKIDRLLSRAENLKRPIYVRFASKDKERLIRSENDEEWIYRRGNKWRKLGTRSEVVDDQGRVYGRGQHAANEAFEILRRRKTQTTIPTGSTKKSTKNVIRIASWNIKFLTASAHQAGDTLRIERRLKRIANTILSNHFDVIVIQEVCSGGGGRSALEKLCRKYLSESWTFRVWPDRHHGRVCLSLSLSLSRISYTHTHTPDTR